MECSTAVKPSDRQPRFWKQRRNIIALMAFLGFFNVFTLRANLSVGIVAMTTSTINGTKEFDWSPEIRGVVLSSFFYGYICTQIVGGLLAVKFGGVRLIGYGILSTAIFTVLTPLAAKYSVYLIIFFRFLEGLFEGIVLPSVHAMWSKWAPPAERTRLGLFAFSGNCLGTAIGYQICGWCAEKFGWAYTFYVPGFVAIVWCTVWLMCIAETPAQDKSISKAELKYIVDSLGPTDETAINLFNCPWKDIFKSMPVWAINCAHFCENWGTYTLLTQLPSFISDTLKLDVGKGSLLSAMPYLIMTVVLQFVGFFVDWLRKNSSLSNTQIRKTFNSGAFLGQATFMLLTAISSSGFESMVYLTLTLTVGAFALSGYSVNHLDVAPQYAGILYGISNTFASIPGIVSPMVTSKIVRNKSAEEWKWVFMISSGVYFCGAIFYATFASAERQPWAEVKAPERKNQEVNAPLI
ncbi:Major facilitator superfamily,Major facilitator superfamily domain [Cinara cedri]|uniref:Sialin n=1 Tax=Cinara cedri TaxID=506608 RepID=A0A5E4N0I0_9HEMI|nr:Major facilitator superfamily,Major facilitator superfamily domain [Cinara cedri]